MRSKESRLKFRLKSIIFDGKNPMITIWHNNRCSKSRTSLQFLEEYNEEIAIFEYLKTPPTKEQIRDVIQKLNISAIELVRKNEELYKTSFKDKNLSEEEWVEIFSMHPVLIERPIVIKGNHAVIGRPIEKVKVLLQK
jgi:arsenate reductase